MHVTFRWQRLMKHLPVYIFCKPTPIQKDFFLDHCLPRIQFQLMHLLNFLWDFVLHYNQSLLRELNSTLPCQIAIIYHVMFLPSLHFPNNISTSTESVSVHTQWSHTFRRTVHHGEKAWGKRWPSWTLACRRFTTRVKVTKQSVKFHCEIYLTPSLKSVLQGLTNVRLMVMSPSTMKYLSVDTLLLSLVKQWH